MFVERLSLCLDWLGRTAMDMSSVVVSAHLVWELDTNALLLMPQLFEGCARQGLSSWAIACCDVVEAKACLEAHRSCHIRKLFIGVWAELRPG